MGKNRLNEETSEYLLQHKDNPVHWWSWGEEAFAHAKESGKPVLLSVGYAACHWCHVMAHESFEDEAIASLMNELFVNIKLDREERPDIDKIYMTALHHLGEQGGWPLNMFLTPDGEPFWGGTYFPKTPKYGRPGFATVLQSISDIFQKEPEKVKQNTGALKERLNKAVVQSEGASPDTPLELVLEKLFTIMDMEKGGPKGAPKFPQSALLALFWLGYQKNGTANYKDIVEISLKNMCQGGIYDHLGGGFSRYSVDERWLVPHFEKMLYDNAQLISVMCSAYLDNPDPLFRTRIEETTNWLMKEMRSDEGAFYASLDADSEGVEGKYYVWDKAQIEKILPPELADSFVKTYGVDGLDDKILADWNGLLIAALARSSVIFENKSWLTAAKNAFSFIASKMRISDKLAHSYAKGASKHASMLDDYAFMIKAGLTLYEVSADTSYLVQVQKWAKELDEEFWSAEQDAYYLSSKNDALLITRLMSAADDATPSGNSVMIENLVRLYSATGIDEYMKKAESILKSFSSDVAQNIFSHATYLQGKDFYENYTDIVIIPAPDEDNPTGLIGDVARISAPHMIINLYTDNSITETHPAFGKKAINGQNTYYVCKKQACSPPLSSIDALKDHLT